MTDTLWWYVARSSGLVAWALLMLVVALGAAQAARLLSHPGGPRWVAEVHRYAGGLASIFVVLHLVALELDRRSHFGLVRLLVPFTSHYRPLAVAWGIVALYLLAAVELTSLARARLPRALWRRIHFASYPLLWLATLHGATTGTDTTTHVFTVVSATLICGVVFVVLTRVLMRPPGGRQRRPARQPARRADPAPAAADGMAVRARART